jgi:hypothetical protein
MNHAIVQAICVLQDAISIMLWNDATAINACTHHSYTSQMAGTKETLHGWKCWCCTLCTGAARTAAVSTLSAISIPQQQQTLAAESYPIIIGYGKKFHQYSTAATHCNEELCLAHCCALSGVESTNILDSNAAVLPSESCETFMSKTLALGTLALRWQPPRHLQSTRM